MTTEPKFIPEKAVNIELSGGGSFRARLIDCVGYMVDGALGHEEQDAPRLVKSPWFDHEVPFDLAFFRTPFAPGYQNVYWTLALGVLAMAGLAHFEKEDGSTGWQGLLCAGGCVLLGFLANTDYNGIGVLIICALYLTRADRKRQCIVGAVLFAFEYTAPLAFVLIWLYNGQRGNCSRAMQKVFYWFYPVHIALLAGVTNFLL